MSYRMLAAGIVMLGFGAATGVSAAAQGGSAHTSLPLVNPGQRPPAPVAPATSFRSHFGAFGAFGRSSRFGRFPWWGAAPYGQIYYPPEEAPSIVSIPVPYPLYPPYENFSERSRPPVAYEPGCRTDTQTVPSETGGERTISITRCY
jgi:hypothetical protein